ncbi:hypothetical protein HK104_010799 [Borealophlyctis nickersoniae]|nr:hypothetical protein HK104_010799 [Borealophlyctis nickersoniae]
MGKEVVEFDENVVVVEDKFPKSKHHYLVIPRRPIDSLGYLKRSDLPILDTMKRHADALVAKLTAKPTSGMIGEQQFRIGFHAVPSMRQIHLHVISQDFSSPALKNKKHWNSFTTEFFKPFEDVRAMLDSQGKVAFDPPTYEAMLKGPLKCHRCKAEARNLPELKKHIAECRG